jgi:hypothetical protein
MISTNLYGMDCPIAVNNILRDLKLKNYKTEKEKSSTQRLRETGQLFDGTKVMVESSGCETLRTTYQFTYSDFKTPITNTKHWSYLAGDSMNSIQRVPLADIIRKQKILPLEKAIPLDSMLTLIRATIFQTKKGTVLRFETQLEPIVE